MEGQEGRSLRSPRCLHQGRSPVDDLTQQPSANCSRPDRPAPPTTFLPTWSTLTSSSPRVRSPPLPSPPLRSPQLLNPLLSRAGVDAVYCIASNDLFVQSAWGRVLHTEDKVVMLSDSSLKWLTEAGLTQDRTFSLLPFRRRKGGRLIPRVRNQSRTSDSEPVPLASPPSSMTSRSVPLLSRFEPS